LHPRDGTSKQLDLSLREGGPLHPRAPLGITMPAFVDVLLLLLLLLGSCGTSGSIDFFPRNYSLQLNTNRTWRGAAAAGWANQCMACCRDQSRNRDQTVDACRLCDAGLPWWKIASRNRKQVTYTKKKLQSIPDHYRKTVEFGTFVERHKAPIDIVIKSAIIRLYPHCSAPGAYVPTQLWAELLFDTANMDLGFGPHLLGAHFDTAPVNQSTGRFLELYVERAGDTIGKSGTFSKLQNINAIAADSGIFPREFTPSKPYAEAVTARPMAVARAILHMFRGMGQPTNIAFQKDMKADQFTINTIRKGLEDDAGFEMRVIDPPLFVSGPLKAVEKQDSKQLERRERKRLIQLEHDKHRECRKWNVNIACRTHDFAWASLVNPCNGLIFPSVVELNTSENWYCAVVTQRIHLLDVLSRPFFFPYIAPHDPAIRALKVKLLDYLKNTGREQGLEAVWKAGSKLPFDTALDLLDGLDGTIQKVHSPYLSQHVHLHHSALGW